MLSAMGNTTVITISCDTCIMRATAACDDCLVSVMCADEAPQAPSVPVQITRREAVVLDLDEVRAIRLLASAGLVPTLRHREAI
jgi:hypothetical protein